ncbi:MAG: DUF4157 domain-containing protein [Crocinitomix sp.]|nr:DUF4157 domain-containing protein [Crocinitomix sp.]
MAEYSTQSEKSKNLKTDNASVQSKKISSPKLNYLLDNRPEANAQSKLLEVTKNNPHVKQLKATHSKIIKSPQIKHTPQLSNNRNQHSSLQHEPIQKKENNTGLPDNLKSGIEDLSGHSMDDVRVHFNSAKPTQLQAHAYAQGSEIHVASGQEKHLPHEAWHVVQQKQGRVNPTAQINGTININDNASLEHEADVMGAQAMQMKKTGQLSSQNLKTHQAANGLVAQCVGGPKFGLENTGAADNVEVIAGIPLLKAARVTYKAAIKATKDAAIETFNEGDMGDHDRQGVYTAALQAAEMTPAGLVATAGAGFALAAGVITYHGVEIARARLGNLAYVQHAFALGPGLSPVYKRHTLDGPSAKEYVRVNGEHLRREAHRGITPHERAEYAGGNALTPINAAHLTTGETGYSFHAETGAPIARDHDADHLNDLEWLNQKAGTNLGAIPNDPKLIAFLQTRKGVGKGLSATSTNKDITSNHGTAFTGSGNIDIDLARVPTANITHHYKEPGFTRASVKASMGGVNLGQGNALNWESARANESVARNREIVLSSIPHAAVTLHDSPSRIQYETRFRNLYRPQFRVGYDEIIGDSDHNMAVVPVPVIAAGDFPYVADHYTTHRAEIDFNGAIARNAGRAAAAPRIAFADAYAAAYGSAWQREYEEAAWATPYIEANYETSHINVPDTPNHGQIPIGVGGPAGTIAGNAAGTVAGTLAGGGYNG